MIFVLEESLELVLNIVQHNVLEMPVHGKEQLNVPGGE